VGLLTPLRADETQSAWALRCPIVLRLDRCPSGSGTRWFSPRHCGISLQSNRSLHGPIHAGFARLAVELCPGTLMRSVPHGRMFRVWP
jgi:hypothetical protein